MNGFGNAPECAHTVWAASRMWVVALRCSRAEVQVPGLRRATEPFTASAGRRRLRAQREPLHSIWHYVLLFRWLLWTWGNIFREYLFNLHKTKCRHCRIFEKHTKARRGKSCHAERHHPESSLWGSLLHFFQLSFCSCTHSTFFKARVELYCPLCSETVFSLTYSLYRISNIYKRIQSNLMSPSINGHLDLTTCPPSIIPLTSLSCHLYGSLDYEDSFLIFICTT